jgi:hypothetical protein
MRLLNKLRIPPATKGTVIGRDRGTKFIAVQTADGSKEIFRLTDRASVDSGKEIGKGAKKSAKVTVYYTEDAGNLVVDLEWQRVS